MNNPGEELATKKDFEKIMTKEHLYQYENRIMNALIRLRKKISKIETKADAERKFNIIMQRLNDLLNKIDSYNAKSKEFIKLYKQDT